MANEIQWMRQWAATRALGAKRYVVKTGILSWGISMFVAMNVSRLLNGNLSIRTLLLTAVIYILIGGALFGSAMWLVCEARYRKLERRHGPVSSSG